MVYWHKFDPQEFEFEFNEPELAAHKISIDEATEIIWNRFDVRRNKRYHGGYELVGRTDGGRKLKLIVYEKHKGLIRVITGWDV
jgi:hypothetical protein